MYAVIGNTNRSNEPCLFCFDECTPGAIAGLLTTVWRMDEVSVRSKILDIKLFAKTISAFEHRVSLRLSISQSIDFFKGLECDQARFELATSIERAISEAAGLSRNFRCFAWFSNRLHLKSQIASFQFTGHLPIEAQTLILIHAP